MLDIEGLRLTEVEIESLYKGSPAFETEDTDIANAQLAKCLWGVAEWMASLDQYHSQGEPWTCVSREFLRDHLLAAGIKNPAEAD